MFFRKATDLFYSQQHVTAETLTIVAATSFRRRAVLLAGTIALHRFSISSLDLRIDAARRPKQGQSMHRFSISSPDLRIDAAKRSKQGNPSSPREDGIVPRPGNAGWAGTSDGVAARGFVNGEGACRAAVGGKAPQVRTGPKSLPAGRAGHGNSPIPRRQTRTWQHGPCPQAARPCPHHTKSPDSFLNRDP